MLSNEPPNILRIKRKRGQDPLQALILEDRRASKRSKPSSPKTPGTPIGDEKASKIRNFYFELTRTDDSDIVKDDSVISSILSEASGVDKPLDNDRKDSVTREFVIPKTQTEENIYIPNELSDMVNSLLKVEGEVKERKKRNRNKSFSLQSVPEINPDPSDYVYDVYELSASEPLTSANFPQTQIGYIRYFEDEDNTFNFSDDSTKDVLSDNEDSNSEGFYQNDYPSDEDAGLYSETYSDNEDEEKMESSQFNETGEIDEQYMNINNVNTQNQFDDLYDDIYGEEFENNGVNFLADDQYNDSDQEEYQRNYFFESDKNDEMAIHRDKIFGKLQRMINEKD